MSPLAAFFAANFTVIFFGTGLVFVLMGFGAAVAARTFRSSHLAVVRGLPLLAAFGLLEGMAQWGVIFIPLQAGYLAEPAVAGLLALQALASALALACLLAFGARLALRTAGGGRRLAWLGWAPAIALVAWFGWFAAARPEAWLLLDGAAAQWRLAGARAATWLLAVPAAALSAWGVLAQRRAMARYYPRAAWFLSGTALAFVLFVPLALAAVPAAPLHGLDQPQPAHFSRVLGVPVQVFLALDGLMLAFFTMQALEVFGREQAQRLEQAEHRRAALEERHRIGRELNDSVLQEIVGVGMLLESARMAQSGAGAASAAVGGGHAAADRVLRAAGEQLAGVVERLRAYVVGLEPMDWESPDLGRGLGQLVEEFRAHTLIPVDLRLDPGVQVAPGAARHLYTVAHGALTRIRRHAGAARVAVHLSAGGGWVELAICHTGRELPPEGGGAGVEQMRQAAAAAGGCLEWRPVPGGGEVRLRLRCSPDAP